MSLDEFLLLPESSDGSYYELHHAEIVQVTAPKRAHVDLQHRPAELDRREAVCLVNGCREFWVAYPQSGMNVSELFAILPSSSRD